MRCSVIHRHRRMSKFWFRSELHTNNHAPLLDRITIIPPPMVIFDLVGVDVDIDK